MDGCFKMNIKKTAIIFAILLSVFVVVVLIFLFAFFRPFGGWEKPVICTGEVARRQIIKRFPQLMSDTDALRLRFSPNDSSNHTMIANELNCYFSSSGFVDSRIFIGFDMAKQNAFNFLNLLCNDTGITTIPPEKHLIETEPRHFGKSYPTDLWEPGKMKSSIYCYDKNVTGSESGTRMIVVYDSTTERLLLSYSSY